MSKRRFASYSAVLLAASLLSSGLQAEARFISKSKRADKVNAAAAQRKPVAVEGHWTGAKAIIFDQTTRTLRKPTKDEVTEIVKTLQQLTTRPGVAIKGAVMADGTTRRGTINGAFATVVIGRATATGEIETRCVQTLEEAIDFLGLVQTQSID
jgi:hypothetical protein